MLETGTLTRNKRVPHIGRRNSALDKECKSVLVIGEGVWESNPPISGRILAGIAVITNAGLGVKRAPRDFLAGQFEEIRVVANFIVRTVAGGGDFAAGQKLPNRAFVYESMDRVMASSLILRHQAQCIASVNGFEFIHAQSAFLERLNMVHDRAVGIIRAENNLRNARKQLQSRYLDWVCRLGHILKEAPEMK